MLKARGARRFVSGVLVGCCVALLAACSGGSETGGDGGNGGGLSGAALLKLVPFAPTPDPDSFYDQPEPFPAKAEPGTIIKARKVPFRPGLSIPLPGQAWQIQYVTRDANGRPLAAVTTVVKPLVPSLSAHPPLLSYQFAYDSLGAQCNPSRTLRGGIANYNNQAETLIYILGQLALGWTIVLPDYEGPYLAYGVGKLSGQAVLDSIRAALALPDAGLNPDTPVGMMGYSGGALATAWAASMQPDYAPELNMVGVAAGGVPADLFGVVQRVEGGPFMGLILGGIVGANRAYPELLPPSILNEDGKALFEEMKDGCVSDNSSLALFKSLSDYTTVADPFSTPGALAVRDKVSLPQPGKAPTVDMFIYHETFDEIIPVAGTAALVKTWCDAGTPISFMRGLVGEHVTGTVAYSVPALLYLTARFDGGLVGGIVEPLIKLGAKRCN